MQGEYIACPLGMFSTPSSRHHGSVGMMFVGDSRMLIWEPRGNPDVCLYISEGVEMLSEDLVSLYLTSRGISLPWDTAVPLRVLYNILISTGADAYDAAEKVEIYLSETPRNRLRKQLIATSKWYYYSFIEETL